VAQRRQPRSRDCHSPIQITNFFKDWLQKHILGTDQKYAPYLKTKGVV